ncbi:hypothetical protein MKX83_23685 [Cytobacillus sp. FSL M8-0252]|uniref:hypothetical protein n=1 Tax=Cytobacillus sp. FSL M8-0252 TaxID=2921621 RepID=UPI0030FBC7C1
MQYMIPKLLHKICFYIMLFIYSAIFTLICYPLSIRYLELSSIDYLLFSMFLLALGGAFFERSFVYFYLELEKDYEAINKIHYVVIFVVKVVVYIVTGIAIYYFKRDLYLALYIPLFLIIGGWIWFSILKGYIKVKREKEKMEAIKFKKQVEC